VEMLTRELKSKQRDIDVSEGQSHSPLSPLHGQGARSAVHGGISLFISNSRSVMCCVCSINGQSINGLLSICHV